MEILEFFEQLEQWDGFNRLNNHLEDLTNPERVVGIIEALENINTNLSAISGFMSEIAYYYNNKI